MTDDVREILVGQGLDPDTATEEQVNAANIFAAAAVLNPQPVTENDLTPEAQLDPDAAPDAGDDDAPTAEPPERVAVAAARPADSSLTLTVDRAQWEDTQREITLSRNERRGREREQLDAAAFTAVTEGRIAPSVREAWRAEIDPGDTPDAASLARAQAAQAALAALPAGRIPLDATAVVPDPEGTVAVDEHGLLPDNVSLLTPGQRSELRARRSA